MTSILAFVFVLGVLIFVHELGHFLAAKFFKVRVEQFALGFGTRLFGFKRGGTDYEAAQHALSLILRFRHRAPNPAAVEAEPQPRLS